MRITELLTKDRMNLDLKSTSKGDVIKEVRAGGESRKIKKQLLDIIDQKIDQLKTDEFGYIK